MAVFTNRLKNAWNAFMNRDPPYDYRYYDGSNSPLVYQEFGSLSSYRPDRLRLTKGNERSIITAIYNRIAVDCAQVNIEHAKLDENGRYVESVKSGLNYCLNTSANVDQTGRALIQDIVMSMFDEGCVAIVPVDTTYNPYVTDAYEIRTLRVGKVVQWCPNHVRVRLYNERTGQFEEVTLLKSIVSIVENPLYAIMNEPNSVLQRLIRKLNLLDVIDEQSGSGKLDLIIQLPYVVKTEARRMQAEERRKNIEMQLANTKYGIAYTDSTEHITQLNRSVDNNLMGQIEYLTNMLYSQLGITKEILEGTANEAVMLNYYNRTVEPIVAAIVLEMNRKFLTKTARTQGQSIVFFRDPFKLVPVNQLAEVADKFTRNEIMSSNEIRQIVGMRPVDDPKADELRNKNLNAQQGQEFASTKEDTETSDLINFPDQ